MCVRITAEGAATPRRRARSAVSTGRRVFVDDGDGNGRWARRYRDLQASHISDLGGRDLLSEAQLSLVRRASAIECELEGYEGKLSQGVPIDIDVFCRAAGHLRRIFESLGLQRQAKPVASFDDYVKQQGIKSIEA
jgi:hypothetical protein